MLALRDTFVSTAGEMKKLLKSLDDTKGLYLRGNVWWFRWPMVKGVQRKPVTLETEDREEAKVRRARLLAMPDLAPAESVRAEVAIHLKDMTARGKYTFATERAKRYILPLFADTLPRGTKVADVTPAQIRAFYDGLVAEGLTPGTIHKRFNDVRAFFTWAVAQGKARLNPTYKIEIAKPPQPVRLRYCEIALMDQLIKNCVREDLKLVFMLGFHAGMRLNEIAHAVPEWFDLQHNTIDMRDTPWKKFNKTKRARRLPLRSELRAFLEVYGLRSPFLLRPDVAPNKKRMYRWDFSKPMRAYMRTQMWEGQDCQWVTPHVMRHTFASLLVLQGKTCWEVAQSLGNSASECEKVYSHMNPRYRDIELVRQAA